MLRDEEMKKVLAHAQRWERVKRVLKKATPIAASTIECHLEDFTCEDIPDLLLSNHNKFLWLLRSTGTWLADMEIQFLDWDLLEEKIKYSKKAFVIDVNVENITEIDCDIDSVKNFYGRD